MVLSFALLCCQVRPPLSSFMLFFVFFFCRTHSRPGDHVARKPIEWQRPGLRSVPMPKFILVIQITCTLQSSVHERTCRRVPRLIGPPYFTFTDGSGRRCVKWNCKRETVYTRKHFVQFFVVCRDILQLHDNQKVTTGRSSTSKSLFPKSAKTTLYIQCVTVLPACVSSWMMRQS